MNFIANSFQQLFADLEYDLQNSPVVEEPYRCDTIIDNGIAEEENNYFNFNTISGPTIYMNYENLDETGNFSELVQYQPSFIPNEASISSSNSNTSHEILYEFDYLNEENAFPSDDFDWENQFLENFIELPDLNNLLPDKTPLCNDSCNLFLKESSENLNKYRQPFESNADDDYEISKKKRRDKNEVSYKLSFPCTWESCKKIYSKPAHLKAHLRRHLGDKPYVCDWSNCKWRFSRSDELARHKRSHSGVKPFQCIYCPKRFARSDHLAKHKKVHERKMAACKSKGILYNPNMLRVRPGRKPKNCEYF